MDAVKLKMSVELITQCLIGVHFTSQRAAREIAINDNLKNIIVQIPASEIPVIVAGLIEKVEMVLALYPADLDLDVQAD